MRRERVDVQTYYITSISNLLLLTDTTQYARFSRIAECWYVTVSHDSSSYRLRLYRHIIDSSYITVCRGLPGRIDKYGSSECYAYQRLRGSANLQVRKILLHVVKLGN